MNRKRGHQKKDDGRVWDSLNAVSKRTRSLLGIAGPIGVLANTVYQARINKESWLDFFDMPDFVNKARQLETDLTRYRTEFESICSQHAGKSGTENNPDEWLRSIQINESYLSWADSFNNSIVPLFEKMTNMVIDAQKKASALSTASL